MKSSVPPITLDELRAKIRKAIGNARGCDVPKSNELAALHGRLLALRYAHLDFPQLWTPDTRPDHIPESNWKHRLKFVRTLQKQRAKLGWHDPDASNGIGACRIAFEFERAMGREFGERDGILARFVAEMIPKIFPGQTPNAENVGRYLARHRWHPGRTKGRSK
jgi:hypothetical protein